MCRYLAICTFCMFGPPRPPEPSPRRNCCPSSRQQNVNTEQTTGTHHNCDNHNSPASFTTTKWSIRPVGGFQLSVIAISWRARLYAANARPRTLFPAVAKTTTKAQPLPNIKSRK